MHLKLSIDATNLKLEKLLVKDYFHMYFIIKHINFFHVQARSYFLLIDKIKLIIYD